MKFALVDKTTAQKAINTARAEGYRIIDKRFADTVSKGDQVKKLFKEKKAAAKKD